jgi:hypothetical protein
MPKSSQSEEQRLFDIILRLNSQAVGLGLGLVFGLGIFVATNWLVLMGGPLDPHGEPVVGLHLQLLSQFFIGYSVSFFGSLIGLAYGFVLGTVSGSVIAWIYNKIVDFRN